MSTDFELTAAQVVKLEIIMPILNDDKPEANLKAAEFLSGFDLPKGIILDNIEFSDSYAALIGVHNWLWMDDLVRAGEDAASQEDIESLAVYIATQTVVSSLRNAIHNEAGR